MVKVLFRTHDGSRTDEVDIPVGESLMSGAVKARVPGIEAVCGGSMVCGTCHVFVDDPWLSGLPAQSSMELELVEYSDNLAPRSRLACQIVLGPEHEGMTVQTPPFQV
jgi:2Fe-2S ferredoxin